MRESDLYAPVHDFLELRFRDRLKPTFGELRGVSAITATAGGTGTGIWSKPDLCLAVLWRQKYGLTWQLDLHGFEVKTKAGCTASSVHEALNHTSLVHYAHLVWHNPSWQDDAGDCRAVIDRCSRYGVGLITFDQPFAPGGAVNANAFNVRLPGRRHEPSGDAVDEFIETRFDKAERDLLSSWLEQVR